MRIKTISSEGFRCPHETTPISASVRETIGKAVWADHPCEDDNHCDIGAALERGYPLAAAYLLMGATDPNLTSMAIEALLFNGHDPSEVNCVAAFDEWCDSEDSTPDAYCGGCESPLYGVDPDWYTCSNCMHGHDSRQED